MYPKKKITFVISDIDKALSFEWLAKSLSNDYNILFILIGQMKTAFASFLQSNEIRFYEVADFSSSSYLKHWLTVFAIIRKEKPQIVHTHLWRANLIGLSTSFFLRIPQRVLTRHHATIHYDEFKSGRKWDVLCNWMATDIIAISQNIKNILTERDKAKASKISLIHHGFDLDYFQSVQEDEVESLRRDYALSKNTYPVIGVISRYMEWKGVQYIIPAFIKLLRQFPDAKLLLANAHGEFGKEIHVLLKELPQKSFIEIRFEKRLAELYKVMDVFVHVPVDPQVEAFGQTYVEALAAGIPSVFSLSGIAPEFIINKENACVVNFKKPDEITSAITDLLTNEELRQKIIANGRLAVQQFSWENHILTLKKLYNKTQG